ncbi:MAG: hypothetical protein H0V89_05215 [Deltaproteobacteria bacterium]|nr:hypothetical protein [Deltaproteobacteria bacterium]
MRRLATIALLATGTGSGMLYWLHDGDLQAAVGPVMRAWATLPDRVGKAVASEQAVEPAGPPPTLPAEVGGPVGITDPLGDGGPGVSGGPEGERP